MKVHVAIINASGRRFTLAGATHEELIGKIANWCRAQPVWAPPHIINTEEIDKLTDKNAMETYFQLNQSDGYDLFENEIELPDIDPLGLVDKA